MADRILEWYIEGVIGSPTDPQGPIYTMERGYRPLVVRINSKHTPGTDIRIYIKDDGVSILGTHLPGLVKGRVSEDVAEDFRESATAIDRYSLVSLYVTGDAHGVTVQLELESVEDNLKRSDT